MTINLVITFIGFGLWFYVGYTIAKRKFITKIPPIGHTSITLIKEISDAEYLLMDCLLIIIDKHSTADVSEIQYQLLKCGFMVQQPLIRKALNELKSKNLITFPKQN